MNADKILKILKNGNERQKKVHRTIRDLQIIEILKDFDPFVAGTLPLDIYTTTSDIDILCYGKDLNNFKHRCDEMFSHIDSFSLREKDISQNSTVICNFMFQTEHFELFCQNVPIENQCGYRHFVVEYNLLSLGGDIARSEIRKLKEAGIKTEPAFAKYFSLPGDPYAVLYSIYGLEEKQLSDLIEEHAK